MSSLLGHLFSTILEAAGSKPTVRLRAPSYLLYLLSLLLQDKPSLVLATTKETTKSSNIVTEDSFERMDIMSVYLHSV